jgi:hypothetical protein
MPSPQPGMICSRGPSKSARATASDRPPNPRPRPQALAVAAIEHPFGAGATRVLDSQSRPHIGAMNLDLSDEEAAALTQELHEIVENEPLPAEGQQQACSRTVVGLRRLQQWMQASPYPICHSILRLVRLEL